MPAPSTYGRVFRGNRPLLLGVVGVLMFWGATNASAETRRAVVQTKDGNVVRGELVRQSDEEVVLSVEGINASFKQEDIVQFRLLDTPEEIYRKKRRALSDRDLAGRLDLAREMLELDALAWAKLELTELERDFPEHPAVLEQTAVVDAKLRLEETEGEATAPDPDDPRRLERRGATEDDPFLSPSQINLIKVYEIDLDTKPRVEIEDETMDSFFEKYKDHRLVPPDRRDRVSIKRLEGYQQLDLLFRIQARDFYDQVDVRQEPAALAKFRRGVNPQYVAGYFAPTFGHGAVPGLSLFNKRPTSEAEAYTNFYRLTQFRHEGNPMINRANPEFSLLLQWGLVRESARFPAPEIEGWRPMFRSTDDSDFQRYVAWIESLFQDDLDYGLNPEPLPETPEAQPSSAVGKGQPNPA
ncbi:MAG: hypothetical protein AAF593_11515 [Planctomycetota bacterium]